MYACRSSRIRRKVVTGTRARRSRGNGEIHAAYLWISYKKQTLEIDLDLCLNYPKAKTPFRFSRHPAQHNGTRVWQWKRTAVEPFLMRIKMLLISSVARLRNISIWNGCRTPWADEGTGVGAAVGCFDMIISWRSAIGILYSFPLPSLSSLYSLNLEVLFVCPGCQATSNNPITGLSELPEEQALELKLPLLKTECNGRMTAPQPDIDSCS